MDRFPLPPEAEYSYRQRFTTEHHGIDIMAPKGTHAVAVEDGTAWAATEPKGGNVVYLDGLSGNRYFYGHLWQWTPNMVISDNPKVPVKAGDALGYVGNTGNAAGRATHLHFQIRRGSLRIDPFPELQAVDPHPERGSRGETVHARPGVLPSMPSMIPFPSLPSGVLLCVALWLVSRALK